MKILMLVPLFYPHIGGVEKHTLEISKILVKQGHKVIIFTYKFNKDLKNIERFDNVSIIRFPKKNYLSVWIRLFKYINFIRKVDIIHCHDFNSFYWIFPFIIFNSKIFITFHGFEKYPVPKINIILRKFAELFTKGNICVGKFISKYYYTKPNYLTYGGIDVKEYNYNNVTTGNSFNSILFIGRLEPDTGILQYIRAIKILKDKYAINVKLEVCGSGYLGDFIESYKKKFNLLINLNGFVRNLDKFYQNCRIVCCSSYLCILESLNRKKIIISIYQNNLKKDYLELSPFSKYICKAKDPFEVAIIIKNILDSNQNVIDKINEGFAFSLKNNWDNVIKLYKKLWKII